MKKKLLSVLLVACMLLPLLPVLPITASAQKGTLGNVGSSTTLYDDISFSETALPMTYGKWLASGLGSGEQGSYRDYALANKNVSWSGPWSVGAVVNGVYEPTEYIISMGDAKNTATSANQDWSTTATGFKLMLDKYLSGATAALWGTDGVFLHYKPGTSSSVRFSGSNAGSALGAYAYTMPTDGVIGLSLATTAKDKPKANDFINDSYENNLAYAYVLIRINDKIVFPENATLDNRTTWGTYNTITELRNAIANLRLPVKAGDVVQFCIAEKTGDNNPKIGMNPIINTYADAEAKEPIATTEYGADSSRTWGTPIQLYPAWVAANVTPDSDANTATDTEANRQAYRAYLLKCGKVTQNSAAGWQVGGYTGENGAFEPIAYRIPFTTNAVFNTTDTAWNNLTWYTTRKGYEYLTDLYIRDSATSNTFSGIWSHSGVVLYQLSQQSIRSSNDYGNKFVYRWTVPAGAGGQVSPYFDAGSSITSNLRLCIVYDGTVIWPEGASLADSTTWEWGNTTAEELNEALAGFFLEAEPGKTLDFCGTSASANDTKLNITINYTDIPTTSTFTEDGTYTVGDFPLVYNAYLTANGLTDGTDAKASYKEYLMQSGKITYTGSWSRGAINVNTGAYEVLDHLIPFWDLALNATAFKTAKNQQWTTNSSTYAMLVDQFIANKTPGVWTVGTVIQSLGDTVRFRLPGNTAQSGIFAYAYQIPANGGGLVSFGAATDTVVYQNAGQAATPYENVDKMYIAIMINGEPVWPQGATRSDTSKWASYANVDALNAGLAEAKIYTEAGDLVQLCVREEDDTNANAYLSLDPIITFYTKGEAMTNLQASVSLGADLALNIHGTVGNQRVLDNMVVTINGQTATPSKQTVKENLSIDTTWTVDGLSAKEMSDEITYSLKNKADGYVYAAGKTTLAAVLAKYIGTNDEATMLVKATLNYGTAAQNYFGYNTGKPANSVLDEIDRVTSEPIKWGYHKEAVVEKTEGAILHWSGATLLLNDVLSLKMLVDATEDVSNRTLQLKMIDENGVAVESEWPIVERGTAGNGRYYKVRIELPMTSYQSEYTLGIYENDVLISDLLTYGVGAYACRMYDYSDTPDAEATKMNDMVDAIIDLGNYAEIYQAAHDANKIDYTQYADVREVDSNLAVAPSVMQTVNTRAQLRGLLEQSPSHALLRVSCIFGANGMANYVVNEDNQPIATLDYALKCLGGKIIPVLAVDGSDVTALENYFTDNYFADMMVLSAVPDTINRLRAVLPTIRGVLDLRGPVTVTEDALAAYVSQAATAGTYVCLFSAERASTALTDYLNHRYMITWYEAEGTSLEETVRLITAGAGGIVTADRKAVEACLTNDTLWAEGSIHRFIPIIGHQGSTFNPTTQANTIEAMKWAQSLGATLVEFDVQITKDDALVLMHDSTVDATTNGTGEVAKMTLAEIKALWVDSHAQAEPVRVPTFEEVLIAFKDSDMVLNIEIKCGDTDLVPIMVDQIRQYGMTDRVRVCCFYDNQIQAMREYAPDIPTSVISNSMNSFEELISRATKFESAYFVKFDQFDYDNLQKLAYRGVGAFLWTPDNHEHIYTSYAEGPWSLCLNWVDRIAENACRLETGASSYSLTAGGSVAASLLATSYKGELVDTSKAEMVIISGNQSLSYENGSISADETGTATVMFRMPVALGDKTVSTSIVVYIYTAPVTVTVS